MYVGLKPIVVLLVVVAMAVADVARRGRVRAEVMDGFERRLCRRRLLLMARMPIALLWLVPNVVGVAAP